MPWLAILFTLLVSGVVSPAQALELKLSPTYWQYKESAGATATIPSTPLNSDASGWAVQAELSLDNVLDEEELWILHGRVGGLLPWQKRTESWRTATGTQTNDLNIYQMDTRLELVRKLKPAEVGIWAAYQWHQQQRSQFVVNGVPSTSGPVRETVQSVWGGVLLGLRPGIMADLHIQATAGLPVWVHTFNTNVGTFHKRKGYQLALSADCDLGTYEDIESRFVMDWSYRKLGGDLQSFGLWPENTWQTLSFGINIRR